MLICFIDTKKRQKLIKEFSAYLYSFFFYFQNAKKLNYLNLKNQLKLVPVSARPTETPFPQTKGAKSLETVEGVTGVWVRRKGCSAQGHDDAVRGTRNRLRGVATTRPTLVHPRLTLHHPLLYPTPPRRPCRQTLYALGDH